MENKIEQLTKILKESNNIVFFGGAGVSTESGIPDFRSSNGLFNEKLNITFTPEQLVSHSFYMRYPEEFFNFYLVLINKSSTSADSKADLVINDSIGKVLSTAINSIS